MEPETQQQGNPNNPTANQNAALINSFIEITSSSKEEALFFLESHQWDLDAALRSRRNPDKKPSASNNPRGIRTLADLNRAPTAGSDSDSDEGQDYFTGGEKSGMVVRDPSKPKDVDSIFNQARQAGAVEGSDDYLRPSSSSSRSFTGTARLLSGETVAAAPPPPPEIVTHNVTFWRNGFTIDDGPLRQLDDPANAAFLESVMNSQCPKELEPADKRTKVDLHLFRRDENYNEPKKPKSAFHGVGRTLGSSSDPNPAASDSSAAAGSITTAPAPSMGLVVDSSLRTTSIQLRLADGTRMVSRFNFHHTIRDIRGFIDASRPGGARNYQLLTMGFPPKQLTDLDQTVEQAGIASSVVIQKY
ncbi:hypothetical protein CCACVL1_08159 [Corchorus capsularis]|uniref:UBX domain-containing protein n=1 Tax=Corchorus capsularis TaxID=210143 RepID=A0A1R3J240_COCAP|nr:hypothetical protein CCACVL1_08159 [Corchorus capsularis]